MTDAQTGDSVSKVESGGFVRRQCPAPSPAAASHDVRTNDNSLHSNNDENAGDHAEGREDLGEGEDAETEVGLGHEDERAKGADLSHVSKSTRRVDEKLTLR